MNERHTLSVVVENHFGVLARVSSLISARGFNIDSLTVSATEDPTISRMTIVVEADAVKLEQVKHQLERLIDVIDVQELQETKFIDRELLLVRVKPNGTDRAAVEEIVMRFGAKLADVTANSIAIEATGDMQALDAFVERLRPHGIVQLVRTGRVALEK